MRNTIAKTFVAIAIGVAGFSAYSSQAPAGETGGTGDMLQRACTVATGRFEAVWIYKETGVQWGEVTSCITESIRLTCQGDICRATGRNRNGQTAVLVKHKASVDRGVTVRFERSEFDRVLKSTTMY